MWAIAAILFSQLGRDINARTLNLGKGVIATICLLILFLPSDLPESSRTYFISNEFWYLALSGLLGITIGDTLYFLTLQRLGARLTLLIGTLIPVVTAISAIVLFDEQISVLAGTGLMMTISGVGYVLWNKVGQSESSKLWISGVLIGSFYILAESGGILLTKLGLGAYDSIEATLIRQIWGVAGLTFWGLAAGSLLVDFKPVRRNRRLLTLFVAASFIGAFLGTWLSIFALEMTYASVAVSLNSTSPLFVIPIAYWFLNEKISKNSVIGAIAAVLGVFLYFMSLS